MLLRRWWQSGKAHGHFLFVEDIHRLTSIPGLKGVRDFTAFVIQAEHTLVFELASNACLNQLFIHDHGRALGAEVACRSEHDSRRHVGGIDEIGVLLLCAGLASRTLRWVGHRMQAVAVLDVPLEKGQVGELIG